MSTNCSKQSNPNTVTTTDELKSIIKRTETTRDSCFQTAPTGHWDPPTEEAWVMREQNAVLNNETHDKVEIED